MKTGTITRGYLCVVTAALMWASSGTAGKELFISGMAPYDLIRIRVTLSAMFILMALGLFSRDLLKIRMKDLPYFIVLGSGLMALCQSSYFMAISRIQVAAAILLQYLAPSLVALYSACFWKEKLTPIKLIALVLSLTGCYLAVGGYNLALLKMNTSGIMWGLISAAAFASYSLLGEKGMQSYNPWTVHFYALLFASVSLNVILPPFQYPLYSYPATQWMHIIYIVIFGTILAYGLYFVGINHIRSTRASITATLEPISAAVFAYVFVGETMQPLQIVGGACVIVSIMLLQFRREHDELSPEIIRRQKDLTSHHSRERSAGTS